MVQSLSERLSRARRPRACSTRCATGSTSTSSEDALPDERELPPQARRRGQRGAARPTSVTSSPASRRSSPPRAAEDLGDDPRDLHPRLVAAAIAATLQALQPDPDAPPETPDEALDRLDDALAFLRGGVAALRRRRAKETA